MKYWISCPSWTCLVDISNDGTITYCCNLLSKFKGQDIANLLAWMESRGWTPEIEEIG